MPNIRDVHPGFGSRIRCLFDPWIRDPGLTTQIMCLELRNHFLCVKILNSLNLKFNKKSVELNWIEFFDADPGWRQFGSGMETVRIRDGKKSDQGSGINIPDPQHRKKLRINTYNFILFTGATLGCSPHPSSSSLVKSYTSQLTQMGRSSPPSCEPETWLQTKSMSGAHATKQDIWLWPKWFARTFWSWE